MTSVHFNVHALMVARVLSKGFLCQAIPSIPFPSKGLPQQKGGKWIEGLPTIAKLLGATGRFSWQTVQISEWRTCPSSPFEVVAQSSWPLPVARIEAAPCCALLACSSYILWMDEIRSHHLSVVVETIVCCYWRGIIISGLVRWCEIDISSIHSRFRATATKLTQVNPLGSFWPKLLGLEGTRNHQESHTQLNVPPVRQHGLGPI